jgi:hypothetical protein
MNNLKDIIIGVIGGLITFCITSFLTEKWDIQLPLWIWLIVLVGVLVLGYAIYRLILWFQVRKIISEFTESAFGDSFVYTWKYKKSSNGRYSVYGYEPIEIRTKKSLSEMNNERVHTCGHEVPEDTIKLFIQLIIIINVNKKMGKKLLPLLEYLQWTENSQLHNLLH